jgi:hypothetical protein
MHTLLLSKVGSALALPAIFWLIYFLGYFRPSPQSEFSTFESKILGALQTQYKSKSGSVQ